MHVKRTRKGEGGQQGSGWRDGNQWVREWPRMNVSTERNRMEPVRGRSLVEAARLDAPERLQSPPGYVSAVLRRNTCWAKILGRWSMGPSPLVPCLHAFLMRFGSRDS